MAEKYLDSTGLSRVWGKVKALVPTKTSDLTNDGADGTSTYVEADALAAVATTGAYSDLSGKPTIGTATISIQKNGSAVDSFSVNATSNKSINITVPTTAADVSALPASTKYGASISVSLNSTDYKITTTLKDQDGNTLGTAQTIDLPIESVVVGGSYDDATKKVILTLQNGNTIEFSVADLVAGLQSEITSTNKLDADLVDDSTSAHKFTTAANLSKLAGIAAGAEVNVQSDWNQSTNTADDYIKNKPTQTSAFTNNGSDGTSTYVEADELAAVATSGSYNDLSNKPTIPTVNNATLTIQKNGTTVKTFTANASSDVTANITVPTAVSELTNDSGYLTASTGVTDFNGATGSVTYKGVLPFYPDESTLYTYAALISYISSGTLPVFVNGDLLYPTVVSQTSIEFHRNLPSANDSYLIVSTSGWSYGTETGIMLQGDMVALTDNEIDTICV